MAWQGKLSALPWLTRRDRDDCCFFVNSMRTAQAIGADDLNLIDYLYIQAAESFLQDLL